jgi:hypothetical protein
VSETIRIPGYTKSENPDECGQAALLWVNSVRDNETYSAWEEMSKEPRSIWQMVWSTRQGLGLVEVQAGVNNCTPQILRPLLDSFRAELLKIWNQENLSDLGAAPTRYIDETKALVPLVIDVWEKRIIENVALPTIIVPMILEDGRWKFHVPGKAWLDDQK